MRRTLENDIAKLKAQEETQYELLETKQYTREVFERRNKALRDKLNKAQRQLDELGTTPTRESREKLVELKKSLSSLNDSTIPISDKNMLLKSIIERIDVDSTQTNKYKEYDVNIRITLRI